MSFETRRPIGKFDRQVLTKSIAAATLCLVTFTTLRLLLLLMDGPSRFDVWLEEHVRQRHASQTIKILEHLASLPGSRKGAVAVILIIAVWAWLQRRDIRPGLLLIAAFMATTATVALLKTFIVQVMPIGSPSAEVENRVFLSSHSANAVAVFAMLAVVIALSGRRDLLPWVVTLAIAVVSAVALSVMAADSHYPIDVLSGASVAGFWVSVLVPVGNFMWSRPDPPPLHAPVPGILPTLSEDLGEGTDKSS